METWYILRYGTAHPRYDMVHPRYDTVHPRYDTVHAWYDTVHAQYNTVHARYDTGHARYDMVHARQSTCLIATNVCELKRPNLVSRYGNEILASSYHVKYYHCMSQVGFLQEINHLTKF
jgi:hypothetical protein